jgi:hypothetical protein
LNQAGTKIESWTKQVQAKKSSGGNIFAKVGDSFASVAQGGVQSAFSTLGRIASAATPATIFAGAIAGATALAYVVQQVGTQMRAAREAAKALGTDVEGFTSIQFAAKVAGVSADALKGGLLKLQSVVHASGGESARVFDQLGLSAEALKKLPIDQAIGQIAEKLKAIQDPAKQSRLGIELFGDKYAELQQLLNKGDKGIKAFSDAALAAGISFNAIDSAKVIEAQEGLSRLSGMWDGLKNSLAKNTPKVLDFGIKSLVYGFAAIADVLAFIGIEITRVFVKPIQLAIQSAAKLAKVLGDTSLANQLTGASDKIDVFFADLSLEYTDNIGKAKKYFDTFDDLAKKSGDKAKQLNPISALTAEILKGIADLESGLRDSFARIGKTSAEVKILDLQKQGATPDVLQNARVLAELAKNSEIAFGNIKMPPLETYARSIQGLQTLFKSGRLTFDQYREGVLEASRALQSATGDGGTTKTVSGQLRGSQDSVTSIIKAQLQGERQDPQAELKRAFAEAQEIRKQQLASANKLIEVVTDSKGQLGFDIL